MARKKGKNGEKSPWGQCFTRPVPNGRRRSAFLLGRKTQKFSGTNQKSERRRPFGTGLVRHGRDPFNQNSDRSDREKRTTSKGGPVFSKLFRLDRTDPLSFGPKFPEILVKWIAPISPGALLAVLYFSLLFFVPYFSARLYFPSPPLSVPGSPRMDSAAVIAKKIVNLSAIVADLSNR